MSDIKRNVLYNSVLTLSNYVFPLIVFPYVSRVLGVGNIGICNFVDSILQWFVLFSMMGITIVGNREIAMARDNHAERSKTFSELLLLNFSTTLIAIAALIGAMYLVPSLFPYRKLLWVGVVKLTANFACIDWFFRGTEQFKYITGRTILVKALYVVSVFIFVRKAEDYPVYFLLSTLVLAGNALVNIAYAGKLVSFSFKGLSLSRYLKPYLLLGLYMFLTSMYITFNVTYLGFATDNVEVGYYTTASKLQSIIIAFFTAFTGVMLPRMSSLLSDGRKEEFRRYTSKSFELLLMYAIPLVIYTCVCAPEIIRILAGEGYEGAILPARIIMPLILVIGFEQIFVIQIMMPLRRDRAIFINSLVGACLGVTLNLLLVRHLMAVGSAIVWLSCECTVLFLAASYTSRKDSIAFPLRETLKIALHYAPSLAGCILCYELIDSSWIRFIAVSVWMAMYVAVYVLFVRRDEMIINLLKWKK